MRKTVNILEVSVKYQDIPETQDIMELHEHSLHNIPALYNNRLQVTEEPFKVHHVPVKQILDIRNGQEKRIHYIATPEVQDIIDAVVNTNTYEIKQECAEKERKAEEAIARAEQETQYARDNIWLLRQFQQTKEEAWAKESAIGHLICFVLGCGVTVGMVLGG